MAAKPPKPPGNLLNNNSPAAIATEDNNNKLLNQSNENISNNNNNNSYNNYTASYSSNEPDSVHISNNIDPTTTSPSAKPSCNCSNISIMHLFHEMKQEFPTIPDQIVTQCVNENCHDRDNCMLMLRNELALNPIPVQAYPSKVLQRQQQQQKLLQLQQQQQQQQQQQKPSTVLKPIRAAPSPVSVSACVASLNSNNNAQTVVNSTKKHFNNNNNNPTLPSAHVKNFDSVSVDSNLQSSKLDKKDVENTKNLSKPVCVAENTKTTANASDMPTTKTISTIDNSCQHADAVQQQTQQQLQQPQRARPTTLNLNLPHQQQQQQQLRQQLNVQLQQHLQQLQQPKKPVRKAPLPPLPSLPPLPPKPSNNNYTPAALPTRSVQHSSNTSLSSPISSGESEISVNVGSLSSPITTAFVGTSPSVAPQQQTQPHHQLKSPIRHRSVINVQPEPPYTRDFLVSPTSSSAGSNSQKSFTSVNLTLRQPNTSTPQSTIDISAGPGLSSAGGTGLTYSSTSYDARRGCQKNFHITVTDEGGVFSASRIKPRSCYNPAGEQEHDLPGSGIGVVDVDVNLMRSPTSEQFNQQYPYSYPKQQQQQQQRIVANVNNYGDMCLPRENDGFKEILHRQRARREKLTTALRDNKKRLSQVEQEINFLTEPISPGESERLDSEIRKLRCDCEAMLNEVENSKRSAPSIANSQGFNSINSRQQQQLLYQAHPPQPFPRQRPPRPPPATAGRQPMDFIQHHVVSSTPPSTMNSPNQQLPPLPPTYQQLQQQYQQQLLQQQHILQQQQQQHHQHQQHQQQHHQQQPSTDDEDYSDSNTDGGDEEDEEGLDMWACSLCTFRNHPQLNICECCENVRILPGRIRIVPSTATATVANNSQSPATPLLLTQLSASSATHGTATPTLTRAEIAAANSPSATAAGVGSTSLESDANLTQQQFALHT